MDDTLRELIAWLEPAWQKDALCREYPELNWFPERGEDQRRQTAICGRCAVRDECLTAGMDGHEAGIWGGTSSRGRRVIRSARIAA